MKILFGIVDDGDAILFVNEDGEEQRANIVQFAGCNDYLIRSRGQEFEIPADDIVAKFTTGGYEVRI